jgi:hypothetical protein
VIEPTENQEQKQVDEVLSHWSQGDYVLGEEWFVYRFNSQLPLTDEAKNISLQESINLVESEVRGLVVVTQTCDIVRSCFKRPFIEVVPLVEVDKEAMSEIERGRRPQYAFIPGVKDLNLVGDLDRIMTVEKAVLLQWKHQSGCQDDPQRRALGQALARKRVRFAFPDDFNELTNKIQNLFKKKHDKKIDEGEALRALREIRVRATPSWDAAKIELMFFFIRDQGKDKFEGKTWNVFLDKWLKLIPQEEGRYSSYGEVTTLEDLTAQEYIDSDPLDLDYLSG